MKKTLVSLACVTMLVPSVASAVPYQDTDLLSFTAVSNSFAAKFSWADLVGNKLSGSPFEADGKYSFTLTDVSSSRVIDWGNNLPDFITGDYDGVSTGSFLATFSGLTTGSKYELSFLGKWNGPASLSVSASPWVAVTAVPEPETYAMMLAGLGLVGTMVRRRRNRT